LLWNRLNDDIWHFKSNHSEIFRIYFFIAKLSMVPPPFHPQKYMEGEAENPFVATEMGDTAVRSGANPHGQKDSGSDQI
jgi:hypothetical protein